MSRPPSSFTAPTPRSRAFLKPYSIYRKVKVNLQELTISGLCIVQTIKIPRITAITAHDTNRNMLRHLLVVSVIVVILDIAILTFQFANLYCF
jgi:hypothetical protein